MARYHINDEGVAGICQAQKKCRFGEDTPHYATLAEAEVAHEHSQGQQVLTLTKKKGPNDAKNLDPILHDPLPPFNHGYSRYRLLEATDAEPVDYYANVYSDVTYVDAQEAVEIITNMKRDDWPPSLEEEFQKNKESWADPDGWEVETHYYDDDPEILPPEKLEKDLQNWYYDQPNATDRAGALEHVREKGYETKGLRPEEAVKKILREENGMILKRVESTSSVASYPEVPIQNLRMVKNHYDAVEPREPSAKSSNSSQIDGILQWAPNGYRVLDGYHRIKWLKENGKDKGNFLVLQ